MFKYISFALRFAYTYYFHKTYPYFGNLPYYKSVKIGTIANVIAGGEFKIADKYVLTTIGWVKFESNEQQVINSKEYKARQAEIRKELSHLKLTDDNYDIKV